MFVSHAGVVGEKMNMPATASSTTTTAITIHSGFRFQLDFMVGGIVPSGTGTPRVVGGIVCGGTPNEPSEDGTAGVGVPKRSEAIGLCVAPVVLLIACKSRSCEVSPLISASISAPTKRIL